MPMVLFDAGQLHPDDITGIWVFENQLCGVINPYPRRSAMTASIDMFSNNDRTFRVFVKTADLNIVNLTGAEGILTVKTDISDTVAILTKSTDNPEEGQIGSADQGEMFFFFVPEDTATLDARQYVFDVRVILPNGKAYTVFEGYINLSKSVG